MKDNISFSIFRLSLGVGLNHERYMDQILIFKPSWAKTRFSQCPKNQRRVKHGLSTGLLNWKLGRAFENLNKFKDTAQPISDHFPKTTNVVKKWRRFEILGRRSRRGKASKWKWSDKMKWFYNYTCPMPPDSLWVMCQSASDWMWLFILEKWTKEQKVGK